MRVLSIVAVVVLFCAFAPEKRIDQDPWRSPRSADSLFNPYHIEPLTLPQGQEIYNLYCASCHGADGKGTVQAAKRLRSFQDSSFRAQTNGAIFWKIREGRGEMPSFRDALSEEQKWQLVEYVRDLSKPFDQQANPFKGH